MNKTELRQKYKKIREAVANPEDKAKRAASLFQNGFDIQEGDIVALYCPTQSEICTRKLWLELSSKSIKCVLPVIQQDSRILQFANWQDDTKLAPNRYGIMEPEGPEFVQPDYTVVPMLAFDRRGYRLGYGGGYYDATLQALRKEKEIPAIGLAYEVQKCSFNLPVEPHDIKLDVVVTEQEIYRF